MRHAFCIFACALACACTARADVLFDSFGTNGTFNGSQFAPVVWNIDSQGSIFNTGIGLAQKFTVVGGSYSFQSVSLAMEHIQDTNNFAISLLADNAGSPGTVLEQVISRPGNVINGAQVVTYQSSLTPVLAAGNSYWLMVEPVELNTSNQTDNAAYAWYAGNGLGWGATRSFDFGNNTWGSWEFYPDSLRAAFRIDGLAIPEPSALSLVFLAMLLCGWRRFRR